MPRFSAGAALAVALVQFTGCAGTSLKRLDGTPEIPSELASDLGQFEVKADSAAAPEPAPPVQAGMASAPAGPVPVAAPVVKKPSRKALKSGFEYPFRRAAHEPIRVGERLVYEISYLGMTAGLFDLSVQPFKEINDRKVFHILGKAKSSSVFSLFYRLEDTIETFIDHEGVFPHRFQILLDESKQKRNSMELYDPVKARTFYWSRWDHHKRGYNEVKKFFPLRPLSQDSLSSLFFMRNIPLPDGAVATFPVISEGKNWDAVVTVVRRETIDTPMGRTRAVVLKLETKYQGILKKQGDSFIWLSDDDRRFMLRLQAKVRIGTIVAELVSMEPGKLSEGESQPVGKILPPETPLPISAPAGKAGRR